MSEAEKIRALEAENASLKTQLAATLAELAALKQLFDQLKAGQTPASPSGSTAATSPNPTTQTPAKKEPPAFVKANRPARPPKTKKRKKRAVHHNQTRHLEKPTRQVQHRLEKCPCCQSRLGGQILSWKRQVVELAAPPPVEIIEHQIYKGWCSQCKKWRSADPKLENIVVKGSRFGVRVASLVSYLRSSLRLPLELIQHYLATIHQLKISQGGLVGLLRKVATKLSGAVKLLHQHLRSSPIVHADETGWRENGVNGYVWMGATPRGVCYYEYDHSRSGAVARRILGRNFGGVLVTDFLGSYNECGRRHQRCWIHLLRDLHDLKKEYAGRAEVVAWCEQLKRLYEAGGKVVARGVSGAARQYAYEQLVAAVRRLGLRYSEVPEHPCHAKAQLILRHQDELFQYVLVEGLSAHNNLAEQQIRPVVVRRKISGGSRSDEGSQTTFKLLSLFQTWHSHRLNPFEQCLVELQFS
jgi:transposase